MSGSIAVGIRHETGGFETVAAWTNPLPYTFKCRQFALGDYNAFNEYVDFYREDRSNQGYGPTPAVPSEYGYIFFDFLEKQIFSAQCYTSVNRTTISEIAFAARSRPDIAEAFLDNLTFRIDADGRTLPVGTLTQEERDRLKTSRSPDNPFEAFLFRIPGWTVTDFGLSASGLENMRQCLSKTIGLSADEDILWQAAAIERQATEVASRYSCPILA